MESIILVTHNKNKFEEINPIAKRFGITLKMPGSDLEKIEIQADSIVDVSRFSASSAYEILKKPLVIDDSGLFIRSLKGFPGVYSDQAFRSLGNSGILKLMNGVTDRRAYFECCASFCNSKGVTSFTERINGTILNVEKGDNGFGFDPIFTLDDYNGKSLAEVDIHKKNKVSHRGKAFESFFKWYSKLHQRD